MWIRAAATQLFLGLAGAGAAWGGHTPSDSGSAMDRLGDPGASETADPSGVPESGGAGGRDVTVSSIGPVRKDAIGIVPVCALGLPRDLWSESDPERLTRLVAELPDRSLPAIQTLITGLLLAEANPPADAARDGEFFLARVDKLMAMGAVNEAGALVERVQAPDAATFARTLDIALLLGREDDACAALAARPVAGASFATRIFCLVRAEDWNLAALTLEGASALSEITPEEDALLALFLDPDLGNELEAPRPSPITPLDFVVLRAIGETVPTEALPPSFAHADLDGRAGWSAQITAAERLTRAGAVDGEQLLDIYGLDQPPASGGAWERVRAVQSLLTAIEEGDAAAVAATLPEAWRQVKAAGLGVAVARAVAPEIRAFDLGGEARWAATQIIYLTTEAEEIARDTKPRNPRQALMNALALGQAPARLPRHPVERAVSLAFAAPPAPADGAARPPLGEAVLAASALFEAESDTPPAELTSAIEALRNLGLESTAREAALQFVILE